MGTPINDTREWPLCRVLLPTEGMSAAELAAHLQTIGELFARKEPFALLIDSRNAAPPSARERRTIAQNMGAWYRLCPSGLVGVAILLSSALQRGAFTALQWAAGKTFPCRAFPEPEPAEEWLRAALSAAQTPPSRRTQAGLESGKPQS